MKKLIAILLTITLPIWYVPFGLCIMYFGFCNDAYKNILKIIEKEFKND